MAGNLVWIDGEYYPKEEAKINVFDHGLLYGDGVFEGIRIYGHRIMKLRSHLERLFESARSISLDIGYTIDEVDRLVRETVKKNELADGYIRLIITRGVGSLGVNPFQCPKSSMIIIAGGIAVYPPEHYEKGITLMTATTMQKHPSMLNPRVKSLNYLPNMMAKMEALRADIDEAVLLNLNGHITECVGENIFAVRKCKDNYVLTTPPEEAGILLGVTRGVAMELAEELGFVVQEKNLTRHDLAIADEIFLTGTGAEIVPVRQYDGLEISGGLPGPCTKKMMERYRELLKEAPED